MLLHEVVTGTPSTDAFDKRLAGSLLYDCLHPSRSSALTRQYYRPLPERTPNSASPSTGSGAWRAASPRRTPTPGFTLCFRLEEAAPRTSTPGASLPGRRQDDPSYQLSLAEYWPLSQKARAEAPAARRRFESSSCWRSAPPRGSIPAIWDGLATDRPTGLTLSLDQAFAFLQESAWVLEDAGYTIIVPGLDAPGSAPAKIRLKTTASPKKGSAVVSTAP